MQSCANLSSQAKTIACSVVLFSLIFFSPTSVKADGNNSSVKTLEISGQPDQKWQTVGEVFDIRNTSSSAGYGMRENYFTTSSSKGFDLANANLMIVRSKSTNHSNFLTNWWVNVGPELKDACWSSVIGELNPVNRADDSGWSSMPGALPRWSGGLRVVPEVTTFGEPGEGGNVLFAYAVSRSGSYEIPMESSRNHTMGCS